MRGREYLTDPEYAPHTPIALFDEHGKLQGWSPTFADDCAQPAAEFRLNRISDFWPEFDALRWAEIWRKSQVDGSATIVQVLARNKQCEHSELIELEIGRFLARDTPLAKVEIRRAAVRRLRLLQQDMLEAMASGVPLKGIMETLCRRVEAMAPSVVCSVLSVDRDLQLRHIASPSIPQHYSTAIDGLLIGPKTGSCGTAAFRGEPVEVTDIATDPLWEDYKHLALGARPARLLVELPSRGPRDASSEPSHSTIRARADRTCSNGKSSICASTFAPSRWSMRRRVRAPTSRRTSIR